MPQTQTRYFRKFVESLGIENIENKREEKKRKFYQNLSWLMNKTAQMFEYDGLPPTLPKIAIERYLQMCGSVAIWNVPPEYKPVGYGASFAYEAPTNVGTEISNPTNVGIEPVGAPNLYAFTFSFADAPDPYQEPYQVIITSPGFRPTISRTLEINKDIIVMRNDTYYQGLYRLHKKYASLLTEAEISLESTLVLLRDQMTFIAKNERQRSAVAAYMEAREVGEYASILAPELGSPLETITHDGRSNAVELAVNGIQSIKSAWFNEIGLNPSFSLKREYTSAQEIDSNTDLLMPIIDDMFEQRKIGVDSINALFGTSITVRKSSAWKVKEKEIKLTLKAEEVQSESPTNVGDEGVREDENVQSSGDDSSGGSS